MDSNLPLTLVETLDEANDFLSWLSNYRGPAIAYDTETGGFDWWRDPLRLAQIGGVDAGWAFQWDRWSGLLEETLRKWDKPIVMHNFSFDMKFTRHNGIDIPLAQVEDTRAMAHFTDSRYSTALKPLCDRYLGPGASAGQGRLHQFMKSHKWDWRTVPGDLKEYWGYGALDTVLTAGLYEVLKPKIDVNEDLQRLYDLELAAQSVIMDMEVRGVHVDLDYVRRKQQELYDWVEQMRGWALKTHGIENMTSNPQLIDHFRLAGWEPAIFTPTGKPKLDKEILEHLAGDFPMAQAVIDVRHAEKMANAYFQNILDKADGDIIHASINPIGTLTGRMTITDPALNTLPRKKLVRGAFKPRPGKKMTLIDYDQMELRAMAAKEFSDCPELQRIIIEGDLDLHKHTASMIYGTPYEDVTKDQRVITKTATYAKLFVSGVKTFAKSANIPIDDARDVMNRFNRVYPEVKEYSDRVCALGNGKPDDEEIQLIGPAGFIHREKAQHAFKLVNHGIQGYCAHVLKRKLVSLTNAGYGGCLLLPVHDEVVGEVDEAEADDALHEMQEIMTDTSLSVPMTVGGKLVDSWGDPYD